MQDHHAPSSTSSWLHVAFWKKPLHLLSHDDGHGHHPHRESPGTSSDTASSSSTDDENGSNSREMARTLGLFDLIMIGIGGTVGSGVFATAGLIASSYAGPAAILSWLIAGIGCLLSGFSFMELSCLIPSTGSTYAYAYHSLGELPAMFAGFLLTLEYGISSAGGARSWSDKFTNWMETELDITGPEWMKPKDSTIDLYAGLLMTACVAIVLCGMQAGKMLVNVVTMTKISVVLFIIVFGFLRFDSANLTPLVPDSTTNSMGQAAFGWPGVFLGASASFYGYIGYDEVCCLAGEAKNPTKNIPRAVIGTILGAALLSTLATFSLVGMQKYTLIDAGESYGNAFAHAGWRWAATIVSTGEVVTMPITTFIGFLAQPRVQYAMAKDGLLPSVFAKVDSHGNLFHGTLICGISLIMLAVCVPFHILWNFISLGILVAFNLTNSSLLLVRATKIHERHGAASPFRGVHSYLIGAFLLTSFLAAYHWQKSVIAHTPKTADSDATAMQRYMEIFGPAVAVCFSIFAFGIMCFLKYIEVSAASAQANGASDGKDDGLSLQTDTKKLKKSPQSHEKSIAVVELSSISTKHIAGQHPGASLRARALSNSSSDDDESSGNDDSTRNGNKHQHLLQLSAIDLSSDASALDRDAASTARANEDEEEDDKPSFEAPLVPFAPCVAIFFNWFLFAQMEVTSVVLIALWLLLALAVYVGYSTRHSLAHQQLAYHRVDAQ
ncbi:Amino acid-polyamine-organocation, partial [Globisporangium splendens]